MMIQRANIYAGLINQYKYKNQTLFSVRFDKKDEDDQKWLKLKYMIIYNFIEI